MTKRRLRFNFRLRSMLICIFCMALLLALYVHFDRVARRQLSTVKAIEKMGVSVYTTDSAFEFHPLKRRGNLGQRTIVPVVSVQEPDRMTQIGRRLLGNVMFTRFTTIIVDESLLGDFDAFQQHISQLPFLDTIYYYQNTLDQSSLDAIKRNRPEIQLEHIAGSPPRMPGKSAMQRYVD